MAIKSVTIKQFRYGLLTSEKPESIPRGSSSRLLNWLTKGTKAELRRGYTLLGTTENSGIGRITGLGVAKKPDGTDIIFRTRKQKVEYLDRTLNDWVEVGSNILPAAVIATDSLGEDIDIEPYSNPTGQQVWLNSPNTGPIKIMTANPGSYAAMYALGTNYKGYFRLKSGRMWVWKRFGNPPNKNDLFASKLDTKGSADYTQISAESIGTGNGVTKTFAGTLAFKAAGPKRICFEVVATDTVETFTDNGDGTLGGSLGGTGTINYMTGAFSITFNTAPLNTQAITATYRWADDSAAGVADFGFSATRVAGEGFVLKQALGADFQNLMSFNGVEYAMHKKASYAVTVSADDLTVTNLIFRNKVGIPNHRAAVETGDGIFYIDDTNTNDPHFRLLTLEVNSTQVVPKSMSKQFKIADVKIGLDLSDYRFDLGAAIEFGDFILYACRTKDSTINNRVFVYNKVNKAHDVLDLQVSIFAVYDGNLIGADSVTDNVYILLSGTDDNQSYIANYWESSLDNLGFAGMKRVRELTLDGDIGPDQALKISMSVDNGPFIEVRSVSDVAADVHAIQGDGAYVDKNQRVSVGAYTLGRGEVGGGGSGLEAYHYRRSFRIALDKFEFVTFRIEAMELGYASIAEFTFRDVRVKWRKTPTKYNVGR